MNWIFNQPGNANDFTDPNAWHIHMTKVSEEIITALTAEILGKAPQLITPQDLDQMRAKLVH